MRLNIFLIAAATFLHHATAYAVTGDDAQPGQPCSVNKAMMMTANPSGIGGYILTCESGTWRATTSADNPTQNKQVATKEYVDQTLADSIATIDTHTYTDIRRYTNTGDLLPLLITDVLPGDWSRIAAYLCSHISDGQFTQGKILPTQRRRIHSGYVRASTGTYHNCEEECITGPSGHYYAWSHSADYSTIGFYQNSLAPYRLPENMGKVATSLCSSFPYPDGTATIDGECMAGATTTRSTISGKSNPSYQPNPYVINDITCWSN